MGKITYTVQTTMLGGWVDVYAGYNLLFSKKFSNVEELEQIKEEIKGIVERVA